MSDLVNETTMRRHIPKAIRKWLIREYPSINVRGLQIHGVGCGERGGCAMYCNCWCHHEVSDE